MLQAVTACNTHVHISIAPRLVNLKGPIRSLIVFHCMSFYCFVIYIQFGCRCTLVFMTTLRVAAIEEALHS